MGFFDPPSEAERVHLEAMGAELRVLRTERGMTLVMVGERAGLTGAYVGAVERGQRRPRRSVLVRIVEAVVDPEFVDRVVAELVGLAEPALAPEEEPRSARRRARREALEVRNLEAAALELKRTISKMRRSGMPRMVDMVPALEKDLSRMERQLAEAREQSATGALEGQGGGE